MDWVKHTYIITTTTATTTRFCHDFASKYYLSLLLLDISLSEASIVTVLLLLCLFKICFLIVIRLCYYLMKVLMKIQFNLELLLLFLLRLTLIMVA